MLLSLLGYWVYVSLSLPYSFPSDVLVPEVLVVTCGCRNTYLPSAIHWCSCTQVQKAGASVKGGVHAYSIFVKQLHHDYKENIIMLVGTVEGHSGSSNTFTSNNHAPNDVSRVFLASAACGCSVWVQRVGAGVSPGAHSLREWVQNLCMQHWVYHKICVYLICIET